ncbi:hypothetical protein KSW81_003376 [Nannochloris sp. 'desiccata']|nr:hypothetical protein KSW81_003376 [Chlorella desiccata (nom. nud.)]
MSLDPLLSHRLAIQEDRPNDGDSSDNSEVSHLPSSIEQPSSQSANSRFKHPNLLWLFGPDNNNNSKTSIYSKLAIGIAVTVSSLWAAIIFLSPAADTPPTPCTRSACPIESFFTWLTWVYFLSGIKFLVTLVKYIPQVVLNCQRQSTEGWNVWNVLLDFEGGVLSLAQQIIDAVFCSSLTPLIGSPIKAGLSFISMMFDVIFMVQHFVLYPNWKRKVAGAAMAADYERIEA